jgi:ABC-type arginine/histidine transport system permease subunit
LKATTLIRGVPDLVLMLLIFYGLQIALNTLTDALGWRSLISTRWWRDYYAGLYLRRLLHRNLPRRFHGGAERTY